MRLGMTRSQLFAGDQIALPHLRDQINNQTFAQDISFASRCTRKEPEEKDADDKEVEREDLPQGVDGLLKQGFLLHRLAHDAIRCLLSSERRKVVLHLQILGLPFRLRLRCVRHGQLG